MVGDPKMKKRNKKLIHMKVYANNNQIKKIINRLNSDIDECHKEGISES